MSRFDCPEPQCGFSAMTATPYFTTIDSETFQNFIGVVRRHQASHAGQHWQKYVLALKVKFRSQLEERDKLCRVCRGEFSKVADRRSATTPTVMHLDPRFVALESLALVHMCCLKKVEDNGADHIKEGLLRANSAKEARRQLRATLPNVDSPHIDLQEGAQSRKEASADKKVEPDSSRENLRHALSWALPHGPVLVAAKDLESVLTYLDKLDAWFEDFKKLGGKS